MKRAARGRDNTATLASWASSSLASSLVLAVVMLFVVIVASDAGGWVREHPVGAASVIVLLACYAISFVCLHRIQKESSTHSVETWFLSLVAACAPLSVLMYWFGTHPAVLVIGIGEVVAVVLHCVAIAILSARKVPA